MTADNGNRSLGFKARLGFSRLPGPTWAKAAVSGGLAIALVAAVTVSLLVASGPDAVPAAGPGATDSPDGTAVLPSDSAVPDGSASPSATAAGAGPNVIADLPLVPWEGGPAYWDQFPKAAAGGWTSSNFFPIGIFYNGIGLDVDVQFDQSYGINSYVNGTGDYLEYKWLAAHGSYWLSFAANNTFPAANAGAQASANWPGVFLDDEPDGRFGSAQNDLNYVLGELNKTPENGRFRFFNFTQIVAGEYPTSATYTKMINSYRGPISIDSYWYTVPICGPGNKGYEYLIHAPVDPAHCRTASSYGRMIKSLRERDAADGTLQPLWSFIENLNGAPGPDHFGNIQAGQLKGAAMNSVINEARGILWFNTSITGNCKNGSALRSIQKYGTMEALPATEACARPQMDAMKEINLQIRRLAPIINTQSYAHTFGPRLDTMLKWYNGSAYVFAMINGEADSVAGSRTFALPAGLASASRVEVVEEGRTIPVSGGQFTDNFAAESTYHIYKITP